MTAYLFVWFSDCNIGETNQKEKKMHLVSLIPDPQSYPFSMSLLLVKFREMLTKGVDLFAIVKGLEAQLKAITNFESYWSLYLPTHTSVYNMYTHIHV